MPRCFNIFILAVAFFSVVLSPASDDLKLSRESVVGTWSGHDTNGLWCKVVFERAHGKVHTFRESKHLNTVNFWWNVDKTRTNILLGVNGHAHALQSGDLQLRLRPVNTDLPTVRDVKLKRVESPGAKP